MKKRILSFILVLSFMFCLPCLSANAENSAYGNEAISHFYNLGIMPENLNAEDYMTRGEFAYIITAITGNRETVAGTFNFYDLAADHPYYEAIQHCVQRGYISGYEGKIRPDDYITYIEGMTIMARVLNYTDYAINNGDYTLGYYSTAKSLGLLQGTNITETSSPMSVANASAMIYNAMRCKMNQLAEISSFYYTYVTSEKTLAYEMFGLNYLKGVMTSNGFTDINGNDNYGKNLVVIDNYKLSARYLDSSYRELIAQEVSVFYDDEYNVVSVVPTQKNTVLTVNREKFNGISGQTLKYVENDTEMKAVISNNAPYFVNGEPVLDFGASEFEKAQFADIRLVDNNSDSYYDAVFVNIYNTFVVYSVDSEGVVSSFNNTEYVDLGEENGKETVIRNGNGDIISAEDITPYSVISVAESKDYVYATVTSGYMQGKLSMMDEYSVVINELECDVPNGTADYFDGITIGSYVNAYFDFAGRLVYVEKNTTLSNDQQFGFIVNCEFDGGFGKELKIKLYTKHGEMVVLKVRNKFKINEVPYVVTKLTSVPDEFYKNGNINHTVILYKSNANNEITDITFSASYLGANEDGFVQTYSAYKKSLTTSGHYYSRVFVSSNTTFFVVPSDDYSSEEDYDVLTFSQLPKTEQTIDAYHFSKNNGYADIVVVHGNASTLTYNTQLSIITKVANGLDENQNEVVKITHFKDNEVVVSVAKDAKVIEQVKKYKPGDAVRLALLNDEITDCERIYDYESKKFTTSSKAGTYATHSLYTLEGFVAFDNNKFFRLNPTNDKINTTDIFTLDGFVYGTAKIMIVENSHRGVTVKTGSVNDVKVGEHIVLQSRGGSLKYIVVYKDK